MTQQRRNNTSSGRASNKINMSLKYIEPLTKQQEIMFETPGNFVAHGSAGTGKTFGALYIALEEVIRKDNFTHVTIIRSAVETRKIGFLPGDDKEKTAIYQNPYKEICQELFGGRADAYDYLVSKGLIRYMTTSFIRGSNLNNSIVLIDEYQNMTFHELDSVITRFGHGCRVMFCGDTHQSDLGPQTGIVRFNKILQDMNEFKFIEFGIEDVVRGPLVKSYLESKYKL